MFGGRPYPVNDPVNDCGIPTPPGPEPDVPWHDGTRQHVRSLGSGTNVQDTGTLVYLGHL